MKLFLKIVGALILTGGIGFAMLFCWAVGLDGRGFE